MPDSVLTVALASAMQTNSISATLHELEPKHPGYDSVKAYLHDFLATAHFRNLTWLEYPYTDTGAFYQALMRSVCRNRDISIRPAPTVDTAILRAAIRQYQTVNKLKVSGKVTSDMVTMMDNSDWEKFKRIAITLDRYKQLPDTLPAGLCLGEPAGLYDGCRGFRFGGAGIEGNCWCAQNKDAIAHQ